VRKVGVEPTSPFRHRNLNPARLPVPPLPQIYYCIAEGSVSSSMANRREPFSGPSDPGTQSAPRIRLLPGKPNQLYSFSHMVGWAKWAPKKQLWNALRQAQQEVSSLRAVPSATSSFGLKDAMVLLAATCLAFAGLRSDDLWTLFPCPLVSAGRTKSLRFVAAHPYGYRWFQESPDTPGNYCDGVASAKEVPAP
jgi:hypothetical protein